MKLVIVESPAKAKTIERFLGADYRVEASNGHIRDLPGRVSDAPGELRTKPWAKLGVDTEESFRPIWVVPEKSRKKIAELRRVMKGAEEILLATDEDREGESISWHLVETLKPQIPVRRIAFNEITRPAIRAALAQPRPVNERLVEAQEARRVLDRLFGFELSEVLWRKVRFGLSAGRVQSVALRLILDREAERRRFRRSRYWVVQATLAAPEGEFPAQLVRTGAQRVANSGSFFDATTGELLTAKKAVVLDEEAATAIAVAAVGATPWQVSEVSRETRRQRPPPPFTTSTLQQAASGRLRMAPDRTMRIAQNLYQGVEIAGGAREGLITYMRTDSLTLSNQALTDTGSYIRETLGADYHTGPRRYRTKSRSAQEAHEAIRPTDVRRTPERMIPFLDADALKLYRLIWNRTVASQMADATVDRTTIDFTVNAGGVEHIFRTTGSVVRFPGFLRVDTNARTKEQRLPALEEGMLVHAGQDGQAPQTDTPPEEGPAHLVGVQAEGKETRPPARYSEAALVKRLEEEGIGRPSTYAETLRKLRQREYVQKRSGGLVPTFVGMAVNDLLCRHFTRYVDIGFTARMEDDLDHIAAGERDRRTFLDRFYWGNDEIPGLKPEIEERRESIAYPVVSLGDCPRTGKPIRIRVGKRAPYLERGEGSGRDTASVPEELLIDELTVERAAELLESAGDVLIGTDPESGLPIYGKAGPYGPYLQLGEGGKGKKGRRTQSLPREWDRHDVTLDDALRLLTLPRSLGKDPNTGRELVATVGGLGPFVKPVDARRGEARGISSLDEVFTITLEEAAALIAQERKSARTRGQTVLQSLGSDPGTGSTIEIRKGRWGPYATDGDTNASLPKGANPEKITLDEAAALLAAKRDRGPATRGKSNGRGRSGRRTPRRSSR